MTKKDLLEAIEDMPMDAKVVIEMRDAYSVEYVTPDIDCNKEDNSITIY